MRTRWLYEPVRQIAVRSADPLDSDAITCSHLTVNRFAPKQGGTPGEIQMIHFCDVMYGFGFPREEPFVLRGYSWREAPPDMADGLSRTWGLPTRGTIHELNRLNGGAK